MLYSCLAEIHILSSATTFDMYRYVVLYFILITYGHVCVKSTCNCGQEKTGGGKKRGGEKGSREISHIFVFEQLVVRVIVVVVVVVVVVVYVRTRS